MLAHAGEMKTIHSIGGRHHLTYFFCKWFYSATVSLGSESSLGLRRSITFISGHSKSICYILLLEVNSPSSQGWPKTSISVFPQISNLLSAMTLAWEKLIYYHIDSRYFLKWKPELLEEKICSSPRHYSLKISIFLQNLRLLQEEIWPGCKILFEYQLLGASHAWPKGMWEDLLLTPTRVWGKS